MVNAYSIALGATKGTLFTSLMSCILMSSFVAWMSCFKAATHSSHCIIIFLYWCYYCQVYSQPWQAGPKSGLGNGMLLELRLILQALAPGALVTRLLDLVVDLPFAAFRRPKQIRTLAFEALY